MIDDHPPILEGYQLLIEKNNWRYLFEFYKAYSCDQSLQILNASAKNHFDIILLDINLPSSEKHFLVNGKELGLKIRQEFKSKIIVLTSLNDAERITNILVSLKPEGFIIKSEITGDVLLNSIDSILAGKSYLSDKVIKIKSSSNISANNCLDKYDLKILYYISRGEKMKNMPTHLPLSLSSIERRKRKIKLYFGIEDASDLDLLEEAKNKGFI